MPGLHRAGLAGTHRSDELRGGVPRARDRKGHRGRPGPLAPARCGLRSIVPRFAGGGDAHGPRQAFLQWVEHVPPGAVLWPGDAQSPFLVFGGPFAAAIGHLRCHGGGNPAAAQAGTVGISGALDQAANAGRLVAVSRRAPGLFGGRKKVQRRAFESAQLCCKRKPRRASCRPVARARRL